MLGEQKVPESRSREARWDGREGGTVRRPLEPPSWAFVLIVRAAGGMGRVSPESDYQLKPS